MDTPELELSFLEGDDGAESDDFVGDETMEEELLPPQLPPQAIETTPTQ